MAITLWSVDADGTPTADFGMDGQVITDIEPEPDEANALAVQSNGQIIVAGKSRNAETGFDYVVLRYNDNLTGVDNLGSSDDISVFPNPAKAGQPLHLSMSLSGPNAQVELIDATGKQMWSISGNALNGKTSWRLPDNLSTGIYQLRLIKEDGRIQVVSVVVGV